MNVSYRPGGWVAVSGPATWLLVDLSADHQMVGRCWLLVRDDARLEDVLDVLVSAGIRQAPAFALVRAGEQRRVIVRGRARVVIDTGSAATTVEAGDGRIWAEADLAKDTEVVHLIGADEGAGVTLPMAAGVTVAASVDVRLGSIAGAVGDPVSLQPLSEPEPEPEPAREPEPEPQPEPQPEPVGRVDGSESYDFLFGATQRPPEPPPAAPLRSELTADWATLSGVDGLPAPEPDPAPPEAPPEARPVAPALPGPGGLIDSLPWLGPIATASPARQPVEPPAAQPVPTTGAGWSPSVPVAAAPAPDPVPAPESQDDEVTATVDRSSLAAFAADAAPAGPTVLAGHCAAGHLSPPHAALCRVCGLPMPEQAGFEIARPPLGVVRLPSGDVVTLDRGVVFGRAPQPPVDAAERPHAVRLVSPDNDISRTHAEVVLDGWHVYIRDLDSTNGTVVTLPGQPPLRLRPHDLQLLENGTVITFADEVSCTFEVSR